jgi:hypothetical protein
MEIVVRHYDSAVVMFDVMGFGKPMDEIPMLLQTGVLNSPAPWCGVGGGLGISLDESPRFAREPAPRTSISRRSHPQGRRRGTAVRGVRIGRRPGCGLEHVTGCA